MSDEFRETEATLTLGDRLNHPFILTRAALRCIDAVQSQLDEQEVIESAMMFRCMIPPELEDTTFTTALTTAVRDESRDNRPTWCGVPIGKPETHTRKILDYYKLITACMSLLYRKGMLSRKIVTESDKLGIIDTTEPAEPAPED